MLALKLWYLFYFAASSCLYPYFNLFFRRAGLSEQQVGIVAALRPWIGLPSGATLSGVADKWRVHRLVLIVTLIISTMARLSVAAVATFPAILCIMLTADAFNACVTVIVDAAAMAACSKEGEYARQRLYGAIGWGCFSFIAGYAVQHFGNNAAFAMSAVLATATLGPTLVLPWGPLHAKLRHQHADEEALETNGGFAHATGKAGTTVHVGYEEDVYLRAAADVVSHPGLEEGTVRNRSPSRSPSKRPISAQSADCDGSDASIRRPEPNIRFFDSVATLASNPDALVFFGMVTVMGTAVGTIECILFLYLEDLGGSESLLGLTLTFTCIAETAVFYFTGSIIRALGLDGCFHLCFAAFLLRLGCYATLSLWGSPWLVLPVELLHGLTFGLTWSAGVAKGASIAPPGLEATTQSAFQGLMFGLGHGIGGMVAGGLYQRYGAQVAFGTSFAVVGLGWAGKVVAQAALRRRKGNAAAAYAPVATVELAPHG